ncbi:MAG TPA: M20 family metallopeptidase [Phycisphaerae bacterium]|nr:M20 family metallopeptidase [Phycisphaerae bacterium]
MSDLQKLIDAILPDMIALRHDLHAHPELGFQEERTSKRVAEVLSSTGNLAIRTGIARTGVVALLNADHPGPCLAIRADMDALPIHEETGVPYASQTPGMMHACGHDGHTSCLVGTALVLSRLADRIPGKIKFIFQPAEENDGGGREMVRAGVLENPHVDAAIAPHAWPAQPVGTISVRPGPAMAAVDTAVITIVGKGSHGAYPHRGIDPILTAAYVVVAMQSIVSRTIDPVDCGVVTVGSIHAGSAPNIIPPECAMQLTLRSHRRETREHLQRMVAQIAENTAKAHGATAKVAIEEGYPVVVNDPVLARWVVEVGREVLGPERATDTDPPSMGAEDFAFYAERVPAVMFRLGVRPADMETYPSLHNPTFNFNDDAMATGIRMLCELAMRFFRDRPLPRE